MAYTDPLLVHEHSDHVKAVILAVPAVTVDPGEGRTGQFALFLPVNGLHGSTKSGSAPSFDFDERDRPFPFGDQVDVPVTVPVPSLEDSPPVLA